METKSNYSINSNNSLRTKYVRNSSHNNQQFNKNNNNNEKEHENNFYFGENSQNIQQQYAPTKYNNQKFYPNTKRVLDANYQDEETLPKNKNSYIPTDSWNQFLSKTSGEESICSKNKKISNSKTFQSSIFQNEYPQEQIRELKPTKYSDHIQKTQITTLPGGVKRGKYDIKDDVNFRQNNTESHLYKMKHDFNSNINFENKGGEYDNVNNYPVQQRFCGSYQRGVKDNDIFNLRGNYNDGNNNNHKKFFKNNNTFESQITFQ